MIESVLLFPEKEAKSVGLLRRRKLSTQNSAKPTQGFGGLPPRKQCLKYRKQWLKVFFFFQKKKQKALVCFAEDLWAPKNSAKPTQGVWGLAPKKTMPRI
jgi:hypothetical protein